MKDTFYRITRCVTNEGGRPRLTEVRAAGYYTDAGKERLTACCGKISPYRVGNQKSAAVKAA